MTGASLSSRLPALTPVVLEDLETILAALDAEQRRFFSGSRVLVTGAAGALGYELLHFLVAAADVLGIERLIAADSFLLGRPDWIHALSAHELLRIERLDITKPEILDLAASERVDVILHLASIASPVAYRARPLETMTANVDGLCRLLAYARTRPLRKLLFFSSSEIYGEPDAAHLPTPEDYRGNVSTVGPRACYDEAKRYAEALCWVHAEHHRVPITIVRPFNNYGPGMALDDGRAPADFARAVLRGQEIELYSDGTPTRTFCYVADGISGYLKAAAHPARALSIFNIGMDGPELSVAAFAELFVRAARELTGRDVRLRRAAASERDYLVDNPSRRCPDIRRARSALGFDPRTTPEAGVRRYLRHLLAERERV